MTRDTKDGSDQNAGKPADTPQPWLRRFMHDLAADIAYDKQTWGDIDENMMARYADGKSSPEEKAKLEQAMKDFPAVREVVEGLMDSDGKPWTDRADRLKGNPRRDR